MFDITERVLAKEALQRAHDEMEARVEERTAELAGANEELRREIEERKRIEEALREREKQLQIERTSLEEMNTALKVLLRKRDEDKKELAENAMSNLRNVALPLLDKLKSSSGPEQLAFLDVLESNLNEITSSFSRNISTKYLALTPTEIQVADLVKRGYTSKEIAKLLNSTSRAIDSHRHSLRKKLGLKSKRDNLRSHLLSYDS